MQFPYKLFLSLHRIVKKVFYISDLFVSYLRVKMVLIDEYNYWMPNILINTVMEIILK